MTASSEQHQQQNGWFTYCTFDLNVVASSGDSNNVSKKKIGCEVIRAGENHIKSRDFTLECI